MDNIETTVKRALDGYDLNADERAAADDVIRRLTERENQIAENIFEAARAEGLNSTQVREVMEGAGITFRTPALSVVAGDDDVLLTEAEWRRRNDPTDTTAATDRAVEELNEMIDKRVAQWKRELGI